MGGTTIGGQHSRDKLKLLYGEDYYQKIGKIGGTKSRGGGFGEGEIGRERAKIFGAKGGRISKRKPRVAL